VQIYDAPLDQLDHRTSQRIIRVLPAIQPNAIHFLHPDCMDNLIFVPHRCWANPDYRCTIMHEASNVPTYFIHNVAGNPEFLLYQEIGRLQDEVHGGLPYMVDELVEEQAEEDLLEDEQAELD
jgi:hypothetical protein